MAWKGPNEDWRRHSQPEADRALGRARSAGWEFKEGGHFGSIRCPHAHSQCILSIFGTSGDKGGTATAQIIDRKMARCPGGEDRPFSTEDSQEILRKLGRATDAAEEFAHQARVLAAADEQRRATEQLVQTARSDQDLDAAIAHETAGEALREQAVAALSRAGATIAGTGVRDPWPPERGAAELAERILEKLALLENMVRLDLNDECAALRARAERLLE